MFQPRARIPEERIEWLVAELHRVFTGCVPPECTKRVARALDDEWFPSAERVRDLRAEDPEQHWSELSDDDIYEFCNVLFWMTPDAFRFYYPAWLSCTLRHWNGRTHPSEWECLSVLDRQRHLADELTMSETQLVETILWELAVSLSADTFCDDGEVFASLYVLQQHRIGLGQAG